MRFSTLIVASFASALMAPLGPAVVAASEESSNPVPQEQEQEDVAPVSELQTHSAPVLWTFELDKDVVETPELVDEIREAFILAANEAHDMAEFRFDGVAIKQIMHEEIDLNNNDAVMLGEGNDEDEAAAAGSFQSIGDTSLRRSRSTRILRWRNYHRATVSYGCNLCRNDDDALMSSSMPAIAPEFYQHKSGLAILKRWEKGFCGKLRRIKMLKRPARCFIFMDLDHQDDVADEPTLEFLSLSEN